MAVERVVLFEEDDPLALACGRTLAPVEVAYATYGTLNAERSNVVFVCHALTGDAEASGPRGWWSTMVGPGRPIDTDTMFVICPNLLGGCQGTTGPTSLDFPPLAISDLVVVHRRLLAERDAGRAILLFSLELEEVRALADRILVIYDGRIVGELSPSASDEELGLLMTGGGAARVAS